MKTQTSLTRKFGHYIQYLLLDSLARLTNLLQLRTRRKLARVLSGFCFDVLKLRKAYVISTLETRLKLNKKAAEILAREIYFNFLFNAFEMSRLKFLSKNQLIEQIKCEGLQHLNKALSRGKGAIIISGHFGLWELVPPWLAIKGYDVTVVVRRQNNLKVDKWMEEMRQTHGAHTTDSGYSIRQILKSLKKGHILALMIDQDNGKQGIFVKFFNEWASAPTGPALISLRTKAPIVPLALFPNYTGCHLLKIYPPVFPENFENSTKGQQLLTQVYTTLFEKIIRRQPKNWFWLHRRWKTGINDAKENEWVKNLNSSLTQT